MNFFRFFRSRPGCYACVVLGCYAGTSDRLPIGRGTLVPSKLVSLHNLLPQQFEPCIHDKLINRGKYIYLLSSYGGVWNCHMLTVN